MSVSNGAGTIKPVVCVSASRILITQEHVQVTNFGMFVDTRMHDDKLKRFPCKGMRNGPPLDVSNYLPLTIWAEP